MKTIRGWAVWTGHSKPAIEWTAQDAKETAESWEDYDGRNCRVCRVEIREVAPKKGKAKT